MCEGKGVWLESHLTEAVMNAGLFLRPGCLILARKGRVSPRNMIVNSLINGNLVLTTQCESVFPDMQISVLDENVSI